MSSHPSHSTRLLPARWNLPALLQLLKPKPGVNAGDVSSIPGSGRSPGEGQGNPLQYFCLENPMDRGVWLATVHKVAKSRTPLKRLSSTNPNFTTNN